MSKPVKLVTSLGTTCLTIEPVAPLTGADVAQLLNDGKAVEQGDAIMQWAEPPAEGGSVIARIISNDCPPAQRVWEVAAEASCKPCLSTPVTRDRSRIHDLNAWAWDLARQGRLTESEEVLGLAYTFLEAVGNDKSLRFYVRTAHAQVAQLRGDHTRCIRLCEDALDSAREAWGEPHVNTAIGQCNLADALSKTGRFEAAKLLIDAGMRVLRDPSFVGDAYSAERLEQLIAEFLPVETLVNRETAGQAFVTDGAMVSERDPLVEPAAGDRVSC